MISVAEAEQIILAHRKDYGTELLPFSAALGRVLAETVLTDHDLPHFNRVAMDGIAIRFADYQAGCRVFRIAAVQSAGEAPLADLPLNACVEIMTGAALPPATDTVVPYEHLRIREGLAEIIQEPVVPGKNIHLQGRDRRAGELVLPAGRVIGPLEVSMAASVGQINPRVRRLPRVAVLSSGDELVDPLEQPTPYQIRRSNTYAIQAALRRYGIEAEMFHLPENLDLTRQVIQSCLDRFDVLLLSGGVSAGKFDFVPQALAECGASPHFHKVRQRPGKPFWFGTFGKEGVIFAFPGNPVSTFLCLNRYFLPWLDASLGIPPRPAQRAILDKTIRFEAPLQYFLQVKLRQDEHARLRAMPLEGNGSGDFSNLTESDAFLELPAERAEFREGEIFPVWSFG